MGNLSERSLHTINDLEGWMKFEHTKILILMSSPLYMKLWVARSNSLTRATGQS